MPNLLTNAWEGVSWHLSWYADWLCDLWANISPLGYVSLCFAVLGVGWIFLKSSVKQMGK